MKKMKFLEKRNFPVQLHEKRKLQVQFKYFSSAITFFRK